MSASVKTKTQVDSSEVVNKPSTQDGMPTPKMPVVRTLKPPPEIWEVVQTVPPKQMTAARALLERLVSSSSMIIILGAVVVSVGVYIGLRSGQRIANVKNTQVVPTKQVDSKRVEAEVNKRPTLENAASTPEVGSTVLPPTEVVGSENLRTKPLRRGSRPIGTATKVDNNSAVAEAALSSQRRQVSPPIDGKPESHALTTAVESARVGSTDSVSNRKSTSTPSRQLIDSPKTNTPRKAKVIQWP